MNFNYLDDVSCYDCQKCVGSNQSRKPMDNYCKSACFRCGPVFSNYMWYNPSQFPYANYYGSYINGYLLPNLSPQNQYPNMSNRSYN
jgi:hypothetical protein